MKINRNLFSAAIFAIVLFVFTKQAYAVKFDLIAPADTLQQGQDVVFTVSIDTEGSSVTSIQTGLTYDTQYLEYKSVAAGVAMDSVTADTTTYGAGKVLFSGSKTAGFNGSGVFATVTFTLIAQESGSTEICTLWTPSPTPTTPAINTPIPTTPPIIPTSPPQPTALPQTGIADSRNTGVVFAFMALLSAAGIFMLSQKRKYIEPKKVSHHTKEDKRKK